MGRVITFLLAICCLGQQISAAEPTKPTGRPIARRSGESIETNGVEPNSLEGQVLALMRDQKKIWAIKVYREKTGTGLKQAKDAVEALAAKHGINPKGAGCAGMVLLMVVLSTIIGMWTLPR